MIVDDADESLLGAAGLGQFPSTIVIAPDGTVAARATGEIPIENLIAFSQEVAGTTP